MAEIDDLKHDANRFLPLSIGVLDAGKYEEILRSKIHEVFTRDLVEEFKSTFVYADLVIHLEELKLEL